MKEKSVVYLDKPGKVGVPHCVESAARRAKELGIKNIVVATTSGRTALAMAKALKAVKHGAAVTAVGYSAEYAAKWGKFEPKIQKEAEALGVTFIMGTHIFGGVDSAVASKFSGFVPAKLIAETYYTLGQGFKVAVEVAVMAADQAAVRPGTDIISIGGTAVGADTAVVLSPANASNFFSLKIREVVCMVSGR